MSFDNFFKEPQAENGGYIWISSKSNFLSSRKTVQKLKPTPIWHMILHFWFYLDIFQNSNKKQLTYYMYLYIHIGDPRKYLMCVITFKAIHTSKKCSSSPSHATSVSSEKNCSHINFWVANKIFFKFFTFAKHYKSLEVESKITL